MTAALEGGEWSAAHPGRTLSPGKNRYPFYRRLGGPQGQSGRAENLVSRTIQPVAQSLYRLSYPAHIYIYIYIYIYIIEQFLCKILSSHTSHAAVQNFFSLSAWWWPYIIYISDIYQLYQLYVSYISYISAISALYQLYISYIRFISAITQLYISRNM